MKVMRFYLTAIHKETVRSSIFSFFKRFQKFILGRREKGDYIDRMQSDVSILTCAPQSTPQLNPHFMRGLKKEPNHFPPSVIDASADIKNVFLSHIGNKPNGSSLIEAETHKIPLDSVETLLRSKSYEAPPSNPDSDLNELLQFVSERSSFSDEKPPIVTSNSYWLSNPSPPPSFPSVKEDESLKSPKLPTVDQIMKYPRSVSPFTESELFSSINVPSFDQSPDFVSTTSSSVNFTSSSVADGQSILPMQNSSEISSSLSCKVRF